jgi:hypothetical protein
MIDQVLGFLKPLFEAYLGGYGVVVQIVAIIGTARAFMKPIMSFLHEFVVLTPTLKDDEILKKLEDSKIFKVVLYVLDWILSLKFIKK